VDINKLVETQYVTRVYENGKIVTRVDNSRGGVTRTNQYTIGEAIKLGVVWEHNAKRTTADAVAAGLRSHDAAKSLPTVRMLMDIRYM